MNGSTRSEEVKKTEEASEIEAEAAASSGTAQTAALPRIVFRVCTPGQPKFQLRKGEAGLSVFDPNAVSPPLSEAEILQAFRYGSQTVGRSISVIIGQGLRLISVLGDPKLPVRLQAAHAEIRPGPAMTRSQFKAALQGLE